MKKLRIIMSIIFLAVVAGYGLYLFNDIFSVKAVPPEISFENDVIEVSVKDGNDVLLQGVKAVDKQDGDVSDTLIVEEITRFAGDNTRIVFYVAFDKDQNATRASRKIVYNDYKIPDIEIEKPLIFDSFTKNFAPGANVSASSVIDGDITSKVRVLNSSDYTEGDNEIELAVTDSAGGERRFKVTCTINSLVNNDSLKIELKDYFITAKVGDVINPGSYIKDVLVRNESQKSLISQIKYNKVSITNAGVYEINYRLTHGERVAYSRLVILVK